MPRSSGLVACSKHEAPRPVLSGLSVCLYVDLINESFDIHVLYLGICVESATLGQLHISVKRSLYNVHITHISTDQRTC